jgi:hypothetical protein
MAAGLAAVGYATYVAGTWFRYGNPARSRPENHDELLDRFMPTFDVVERRQLEVRAPAAVTLAAAMEMDLSTLPLIRAIFRARELILGAMPDERQRPLGLIAETTSLGWSVLAESPGREIVVGAATKPWEPNVTFRSIPPPAFAAFSEPGYVKIAWTLRADSIATDRSIFRTETRAIATDSAARAKFRWYWSFFSPGIRLIRQMSLRLVKTEAERRALSMEARISAPPARVPSSSDVIS